LLLKQFYQLETFSFIQFCALLLQQCLAKLWARAFLNGPCIARIVQKSIIVNIKTVFLFSLLFEKGMTERVPGKVIALIVGPSLW